jgi:hypothetical protein
MSRLRLHCTALHCTALHCTAATKSADIVAVSSILLSNTHCFAQRTTVQSVPATRVSVVLLVVSQLEMPNFHTLLGSPLLLPSSSKTLSSLPIYIPMKCLFLPLFRGPDAISLKLAIYTIYMLISRTNQHPFRHVGYILSSDYRLAFIFADCPLSIVSPPCKNCNKFIWYIELHGLVRAVETASNFIAPFALSSRVALPGTIDAVNCVHG